ncbi:MAG: hypothetical protein KKF41_03355 [Actinobacteria bacterium]|nr:hypothetical protein [Actinomycetota bacterium]MBU2686603.1 hypothetical protein [Actinomycetota bacterium]
MIKRGKETGAISLVPAAALLAAAVFIGSMLVPTVAIADTSSTPTTPTYVTNGNVYAIASSGGITYIGGAFNQVGPAGGSMETRNRLAAIDESTGAVTSWNPDANGAVNALAVSGNYVYIGGAFASIQSTTRNYAACVDTSGALQGWNPIISNDVRALVIDGTNIYMGGDFATVNSNTRNRAACVDTSGALQGWDPNVGSGSGTNVYALALSGTNVYLGGDFTSVQSTTRNYAACVDTSGALQGWNPNTNGEVRALAIDGTNVYLGGYFTSVQSTTRNYAACVDTSGALQDWNPDVSGTGTVVHALAVSGTNVYMGGAFSAIGGTSRNNAACVDTSAALQVWDPNVSWTVRALSFSGTTLYVGGLFYTIGGASRPYFAQFDDLTITANAGPNGSVSPSGTISVNYGTDKTFTFTHAANYHVADVKVDNVSVGTPDHYDFTNVTASHTIDVRFAIDTFTLTPSAGPNGTIFPDTVQTVNYGTDKTFNIAANDHYQIADVVVDGTTHLGSVSSHTFNNVTANHTITANFTQDQQPTPTWFLAEGTTAWGYECYISIENPNDEAVSATVTYMTDAGAVPGGDIDLPAMSQATVNPASILGEKDFSTKVECKEGKTIAVDRTMTWTGEGAPSPDGHCSIGVTGADTTWYLAEGSSAWGFECWLLIQNPNAQEATAQVTYMIEGADPVTVQKKIPAQSRKTYNMADDIGAKDASIKVDADIPVIPERAMYKNNSRSGHDSIGTTAAAPSYYLAEGTTDWGFTTYVLVQNPNAGDAEVTVTYMTSSGAVPQGSFTMPGNSRKTIRVNDVLPASDFSTQVTGSQPIIAERAMYWGEGTTLGEASHDSIGLSAPHTTFYLPDGETSNGRETYTLVQNPNQVDVTVEVSYLTPDGTGNVVFTETVGANSRKTFNMGDKGISGRAAVMVTCKTAGARIMVERAMYWNSRGAGTDTIGGYSD